MVSQEPPKRWSIVGTCFPLCVISLKLTRIALEAVRVEVSRSNLALISPSGTEIQYRGWSFSCRNGISMRTSSLLCDESAAIVVVTARFAR